MPRAVLLQHFEPGGGSHYDWMVQRPWGDDAPLLTFRVTERLDLAQGAVAFEAHRLSDHRPEYLDFEGPVPGGRGEVRRLCRGDIEIELERARRLLLRGVLGYAQGRWEGHARDQDMWEFTFLPGA